MSLNIKIQTISHKKQRYPTVGDWYEAGGGNLFIVVSKMHDWKKEICVAIHELVEYALCREHNISQEEVDEFDIVYEKNRQEGDNSEPGDDKFCPYRKEHFFATNIERLLCAELGLTWSEYEEAINSL